MSKFEINRNAPDAHLVDRAHLSTWYRPRSGRREQGKRQPSREAAFSATGRPLRTFVVLRNRRLGLSFGLGRWPLAFGMKFDPKDPIVDQFGDKKGEQWQIRLWARFCDHFELISRSIGHPEEHLRRSTVTSDRLLCTQADQLGCDFRHLKK